MTHGMIIDIGLPSSGKFNHQKQKEVPMKFQTAFTDTNVLEPAQNLKHCQNCKSTDIFSFDGDIFCNPCGWNSIEMRVEAQLSSQTAIYQKSRKQKELLRKEHLPTSDELFELEEANAISAEKLLYLNPFNNDDLNVA